MKRMKNIIVLFLTVILTACGATAKTWQDHYDLGMRYLSEGNYKEAIVAFNAAIEIDPKQPDIYIGLTEAYLYVGDYEKAIETLEKGYEVTSDNRLQKETFDFSVWIYDSIISAEELTIGGTPFYNMSIYDAEKSYTNSFEEDIYSSNEGLNYSAYYEGDNGCIGNLDFFQEHGDNVLSQVNYYYTYHSEDGKPIQQYQPEFRGIQLGTSLETVLNKLGLSNHGIEFTNRIIQSNSNKRVEFNGTPLLSIEKTSEGKNQVFFHFAWDNCNLMLRFEDDVLTWINLSTSMY